MWRIVWDAGVCLAVSVILCRFYLLESYMIQTGSMAPNLWGFHKHIQCPGCKFVFSRGAYDEVSNSSSQLPAKCPNCGLEPLKCDDLRRTEGDQILVQKIAYPWLPLKRWDIVVFQSPANSEEAYVKRLIALPGETLDIQDGEIYINGRIARKNLEKQRHMFITVYDDRYRSLLEGSTEEYSRWWPVMQQGETAESSANWEKSKSGFSIKSSTDIRWLKYHHAPQVESSIFAVPLDYWPEHLPKAEDLHPHLSFHPQQKRLTFQGKLSVRELREILQQYKITVDLEHQLFELYERTQGFTLGTLVGNNYAYNGVVTADRIVEHFAHDFKIDFDLITQEKSGQLVVLLCDARHPLELRLDLEKFEAALILEGNVVRSGPLPARLKNKDSWHLEFSTCDACLYLAINGKELFDPFDYTPQLTSAEKFPYVCQIGAQGLTAEVNNLVLSRDVHYEFTEQDRSHVQRKLESRELFMLGDNTPASFDSRKWQAGSVHLEQLIGKPLVVHLPSRTGEFSLFGQKKKIRLPDFSRIRWVQ